MSIEAKIEALTVATDKNTAQLAEVLAALQGNTAIMTTLNDGRTEALAALTAKDAEAPKPAPRSRKKAATEETQTETTTDTASAAETGGADTEGADTEGWNPDISVDGMRAVFTGYMTSTADADEKAKRVANVQAILAELGADAINPMAGKKHIETDDDKRKALFYVARFDAGLPVNFQADYDFNADPLTQDVEPAAGDDDLVG